MGVRGGQKFKGGSWRRNIGLSQLGQRSLQGPHAGPGPSGCHPGLHADSTTPSCGFRGPKPTPAPFSGQKTRGPRGWSGARGRGVVLSWRAAAAGRQEKQGPPRHPSGKLHLNQTRWARSAPLTVCAPAAGGREREAAPGPTPGAAFGRDGQPRPPPDTYCAPQPQAYTFSCNEAIRDRPICCPACVSKAPTMRRSPSPPG